MTPLYESSYNDLYDSAVEAFPHTTMRQHATQPIKVSHFEIVPFVGMHTLFIKAHAVNEGRHYEPIILVKGVLYEQQITPGVIEIIGSDDRLYHLHRPSLENNDIRVRCNCKDFYWRFNYYDHLDHSLYGRKRAPYVALHNSGSANPEEMPGMCKHLMKMAEVLQASGVIGV